MMGSRALRPKDRASAGDEALLDEFVAAALAETERDDAEESASRQAALAAEQVEAFLQRTAAFLNARADRAELLEKLRASIADTSAEPKPKPAADTSDRKPE